MRPLQAACRIELFSIRGLQDEAGNYLMRRVALIYNPASGQHSARRDAHIPNVLAILRKAGIEAEPLETHAPGSGKSLAIAAVRQGYDAVLACGGDGTVHEVLQALV